MSEAQRERREQDRPARNDFGAAAKEVALLAANVADPQLREVIEQGLAVMREDWPNNLIAAQMLLAVMAAAARNDVPSVRLLIFILVEYNMQVIRQAQRELSTALLIAKLVVPTALSKGTASPTPDAFPT